MSGYPGCTTWALTSRSMDALIPPLAALTVTVNGPASASGLSPFDAVTEYTKLVVPAGGDPDTTPVDPSIDKNAGAPDPRANVGAGLPDAPNAYEYTEPTVAVSGGESAVNNGAAVTRPGLARNASVAV